LKAFYCEDLADHSPDKPDLKGNWLVREITKYKLQITNKASAPTAMKIFFFAT